MSRSRLIPLLILLLATSSAPAAPPLSDGADYQEIQRSWQTGNREDALKRIAAFEKKFPTSPLLPQAKNLQGLLLVLSKKSSEAIGPFKVAIEGSKNEAFNQAVGYNLATAYYESGQPGDAIPILEGLKLDLLDAENRLKALTLRARTHQRLEHWGEAARDQLEAARLQENPEQKKALVTSLDQALQKVQDPALLIQLADDHSDTAGADLVLLRLANIHLQSGKSPEAEGTLKRLLSAFPDSSRTADAQELLRLIQNQAEVDSKKVGVLLPLSGKFAPFGQRALQAISLAFRIFNSDEPDSKMSLVIEDSGEDAQSALAGLERLYLRHHVIAVLGPLLSKGIEQVNAKAQDLGLPVLTLSQNPGTASENSFPMGFTPRTQAREIARFAIETRGLKRFAILHPRDRFGEEFSQAFWDAVEALGGEIVAYESYPPGETDFRQSIDRLSGLYYTEAREKELADLAEQRKALNITRKTRKTEMYFNLKPIVDYEAVFIPDEPKVVGQILPTFAYRDVPKVQFLGINTWNSPELFQRAQAWAAGSLFTEAFHPESGPTQARKFAARYRQTYDTDPGAIEALAFDAAAVVERVLSEGAITRAEVRDGLRAMNRFPGVTGELGWRPEGFTRRVSILGINRAGQITPAPNQPER